MRFLFFVNIALAQGENVKSSIRSNDKSFEPYIQTGVCPFECCQYGSWTARSEINVYASEGDTSKVIFTMSLGSRFEAHTGNVHINKLGKVRVNETVLLQDIDNLSNSFEVKKADIVYILSYRGEGYYSVLYNGKKTTVEGFWSDGRFGTLLQESEMFWWVSVT